MTFVILGSPLMKAWQLKSFDMSFIKLKLSDGFFALIPITRTLVNITLVAKLT